MLIGYAEAEDEIYKYRREKIVVLNPKDNHNRQISISKPKGDVEMKNIYYRPTEKRYVGRKQIFGTSIEVYGKTQIECYKKLNEKIRQLKSKIANPYSKTPQTFIVCWDKWYKQNKEPFIADTTRDDFQILRRKLSPIHNTNIKKLSKDAILEFLAKVENNRTKDKLVVQLKAFFKYATLERLINYNPFNTIVYKNQKYKSKPAFTYEQQKTILDNLKGKPFKPIVLFFLVTGIRKNEIDFKNIENCIDSKNILTIRNLKGRDREVRYKKIKLSEDAKKLVTDNLDIFHSYANELLADHFKAFLKFLGINGSLVTCRHTFATNCFYLGKDPLIISREMGHTTAGITKDNYIDIDYGLSKDKILKLYNNLYNLN